MGTDGDQLFAELVTLRSTALQRSAYLIVGDAVAAQDLVREALVRTCQAWPRLKDPYRAEAHARKVATAAAIARSRPPTRDAAVVERPADVDDSTWLWLCLLRLPVRQRAAIVLRHYDELTEREAAEAMGCSVGAMRSQAAAGLAALRPLVRDGLLPQEARP
jgi:RNA polymerase sigma factor (sigma-70 family)